jgi:hypothetical protein
MAHSRSSDRAAPYNASKGELGFEDPRMAPNAPSSAPLALVCVDLLQLKYLRETIRSVAMDGQRPSTLRAIHRLLIASLATRSPGLRPTVRLFELTWNK